jgi:arginine decarboxylase-like protein
VHFDTDALKRAYHSKLDAAALSDKEREFYRAALEDGLTGYTYLED